MVEYFGGKAEASARAAIEAHLDQCADCRQTLSALAQAPDIELDSTLPAPVREPELDALLATGGLDGKYQFARLLGAGGMGVVVEARHVTLGQPVAIKFMRPSLKNHRSAEKRFLNEARHSAQLKSPHVVRVTDVGHAPNQLPYLVMELLEGEDLERRLTQGLPPIELALRYTAQVLDALAEAHARGLIHRDLKPANLFLARQANGTHAVKVLDFGLARPLDDADGALTQTGSLIGSPLYMAPEQLKAGGPVDARTDLWALGCVMYRMLTGRLPFVADSLGEVLARIQRDPPAPIRQLRPAIPPELEAVVMALLEKNPAQRPASVAEVALRLMPLVPPDVRAQLQPLAMRGSGSLVADAAVPGRTPRWPIAAAAAALLALGAWSLLPRAAPEPPAPTAVPPAPAPVVDVVAPAPAPPPAVAPAPAPVAAPVPLAPKPGRPRPPPSPKRDQVYDERN